MIIIIAVLVIFFSILVSAGIALPKHNYGNKTDLLESASRNTKKALVVYQPSLTSASHDIAYAIARGLNDCGYEVKISYPNAELSTDVSVYSIIVFGSPNYGGAMAAPLTNYIQQIDDFSGKKVILYSTFGLDENIRFELEKLTTFIHGTEPYAAIKYRFSETESNIAAAYQLGADAAEK